MLFPGDLFIWVFPNAGNPQKVQRYPDDWAVALRKMAALGPELFVPAHGLPIVGTDRISMAVSYTHLRAHETVLDLVCRLLLEKKTQNRPHTKLDACVQSVICQGE